MNIQPCMLVPLLGWFFCCGCDSGVGNARNRSKNNPALVKNIGSDAMVNLAQAWAESYHSANPRVSVEVSGGGSAIGIAALLHGTGDVANSSRQLKPQEATDAEAKVGKPLTEHLVAFEGFAIFVHPTNPIEEMSMEQLREIYADEGSINKWSDLGVAAPSGQDEIIRIDLSSSDRFYFREVILGRKRDFKSGSRVVDRSDRMSFITSAPNAIGFARTGFERKHVKMIKASRKTGESAVGPEDRTYPLRRPLFMYATANASAHIKQYIAWIVSAPGQKVVSEKGFIPLPAFAPPQRR